MSEFNPAQFEEEAHEKWAHAFHSDPSDLPKYYLNVAFPYPSGAMHVGHGRTYIVPDIVARFQRMKGKQVLFPMGFHVTGAPVVGISKRIARKDEKTIRLYRDLYRVPQNVLDNFTDPLVIVKHFADEYQRVMTACGLSIDWRRRFITVDPTYSKFIEWQWKHLYEAGHVMKGAHPVRYCTVDENPVGDHDLLEGDKAEVIKFTLMMFCFGDAFIPCATLRPETIYGVTNLWANPKVTYVKALVDGKAWIVSKEAAEKLALQDHTVEIKEDIPGTSLVDKKVSHPLCGEVPILPAEFVDPDMASGMVMSVPAHAPFDYIALRDLQQKGKYTTIKPIPLIKVEGYGEVPAQDAVEKAGIKDQMDPRMDSLTQEIYSAEFAKGRLFDKYGGKPVRVARDDVAAEMIAKYGSVPMYEFDIRPVVCRCGNRVRVKILHDQWFLKYSDPVWKQEVQDQINDMALVPPEVRVEFDRTIWWLKDWACTRRVGLGTRFPWDTNQLIEPLSDSTVYMAYYTIAHKIREIEPKLLTPEVFDYIFLGKKSDDLPEKKKLDAMRKEFLYWYPYDFRFSAKDLISNHLTFQVFHHTTVFAGHKELLPKGMVVFGMGLLNGAKMSSSKGNVFLLEDAVKEFGADTVRMFLMGSAEPWQDFDWRNELVLSTKKQIERFHNTVMEIKDATGEPHDIDRWLASRLQAHIARATEALENFQTRQALQESYFGIEQDLKWYRRRLPKDCDGSRELRELCSVWTRLLAPFIPFTAEHLWKELAGEGLVSFAPWPVADPNLVNPKAELAEELLARTVEDIESILKLIQLQPKAITIALAPAWKHEIFRTIAAAGDKGTVVKEIMKDPAMRKRGKAATDATKQITTLIHRLPPYVVEPLLKDPISEQDVFVAAKEFLAQEFGVPVHIVEAEGAGHTKAATALPFKPAIMIE
ncbi:MAG: Leucine--tRNA ligase [Methanoregula sp. PtaU1.Bin006]|uniref:leucine--tRNA ligase n=1 Tax=Methanoregula sp. PtaU1.Bin006 TaxID=1811681 RepID=UPI0009CF88A1|nr:leucine--tRNA ligase [Methanoregula sp. PtaU1.Bin006]OPY36008.1 MAG: Leucine--tRNA ligase [Methanoregula sp. PtaU1.Bin006]